jgi:integrase
MLTQVRVSKLKGEVYRIIPLPVDPRFEPWTRELLRFAAARKSVCLGLPYSRSGVYRRLKPILRLLGLKSPHSLRHLRSTHLIANYGFTPHQLSLYMGWSLGTVYRSIGMPTGQTSIYVHLGWRQFAPQLFQPLHELYQVEPTSEEVSASMDNYSCFP